MLFNSLDFLIFFPIVILGYFALPRRLKNLWLLLSSYFFYMCWNAKYLLLILISTLITYFSGLAMERIKGLAVTEDRKKRKKQLVVAVSCILNLGILDQMVSLCRENGTELLFVNIPWEGEFAYSEALSQYAEENSCAYLDLYTLTEEIGLDGQTDFADIGHLNASGGRKVGFFLADYLREHYDLTDFREVSQHLWLR